MLVVFAYLASMSFLPCHKHANSYTPTLEVNQQNWWWSAARGCHQWWYFIVAKENDRHQFDRMAVVQTMGKPLWIKTCAQRTDHSTAILDNKCSDYDETHL